ncbi:MAG: hypothetical protein D6794_03975 [Deltaproteobacteria bacterium]|nr:MAG: hypothetical protein D6794_03975 [Deltaproteobacteria bacterium]
MKGLNLASSAKSLLAMGFCLWLMLFAQGAWAQATSLKAAYDLVDKSSPLMQPNANFVGEQEAVAILNQAIVDLGDTEPMDDLAQNEWWLKRNYYRAIVTDINEGYNVPDALTRSQFHLYSLRSKLPADLNINLQSIFSNTVNMLVQ